jgi:hypothetical protein
MDMNAIDLGRLNQEKLNFIVGELKKNYIPTDFVKIEFFARYFPELSDEEVKYFLVIMNHKYKKDIQNLDLEWIRFDNNIPEDIIMIYNKNILNNFGKEYMRYE